MHDNQLYSVALSIISSPAASGLQGALELSDSPVSLYDSLAVRNNLLTQPFVAARYSTAPLEAARQILEETGKGDINTTCYWDTGYPPLLREISSPPLVLYHQGSLDPAPAIAIVGTRKPDHESVQAAQRIASELVGRGFSIVSGMALGIDRAAHAGALSAGGRTVGVLANGIDVFYPLGNIDLFGRMRNAQGSTLVSEYPPGIYAGKWTFVRRNRIISGLCLATVVIQAGERSGALITARYATEQNREVFACPGRIFDETYRGCNRLIQAGAHLLSATDDIVMELPPVRERLQSIPREEDQGGPVLPFFRDTGSGNSEAGEYLPGSTPYMILKYLGNAEVDIDTVIRSMDLSPERFHETLVLLELEGRIIRKGNIIARSG